MNKKEKYKRYGYEDAYDTEKENNWPNRLNLDDCIEIMNNQFNEIVELKQQLAEKDKKIKELKDKYKISFAIEQLEKVKGLIANHTQELWTCENDDIDVSLYEEIDKQINELKGKVEDAKN